MKAKKIIVAVLCAAVVAVVPTFAACGESYTINRYEIDFSTSDFVEALWEKYNEEAGKDLTYEEFLALLSSDIFTSTSVGNCLLSSMKIYTEFIEQAGLSGGNNMHGNQSSRYTKQLYTGGAVIYSMDTDYTYIITNYHVVYDSSADYTKNGGYTPYNVYGYLYGSEGEPTATGYDSNGYTYYDYGDYGIELEYIGGSISADVAVLRANTSEILAINEYAQAVTIADGYSVGDTAIAIGNPNNDGISVTQGIISTVDEYISLNIDGTTRSYRSIRIDTALYSGNSGGGLFNSNGELIGLANAGSSTDENINYAIPLEIVTGTADSIIYYATDEDSSTNGAYTLNTGLEFTSQNSKYVYNKVTGKGAIEEEVVVSSVTLSSLGDYLGIEEGDIITELVVNGTSYAITRTFTLSDLGLTLRADDTIYFVYERDGDSAYTSEYTLIQSDFTLLE